MVWAKDGSLFVGETNRGWGSAGDANQGLQRLVWNGKVPFEMLTCKATPDGFEIDFTMPVDRKSAEDLASYNASSFIYKHHAVYGSPPINREDLKIKGVKVSEDGRKVRVVLDGLRAYYLHELNLTGLRSADTYYNLVHPTVYYTLNSIPTGDKAKLSTYSTMNSGTTKTASASANVKELVSPDGKNQPKVVAVAKPTFANVKPLLMKHTCLACHAEGKKVIGPSFADIAKRKYSDERIVELIYVPEPQNWPDYAVPMMGMPQVPKPDAMEIAGYINSLH
jgi:cytochrome c551/c552